jgi:DNA-binding transcriptional LysR family regulator
VASVRALDLRRLKTLQRIAAHGSFSQAADELHFTQSAVSQQIAALERDVGVQLLNRNPVSLTEPGRMLCDRYESAVAELAAAEAELESFRQGGAGRMRLAAVGAAAARIVPCAAAAFTSRFPALTVHVEQVGGAEALAALRRGDADIALTSGSDDGRETHTGIRWIRLTRERIAVAVPSSHPLARHPGVRLCDLDGERFIHSTSAGIPIETLVEAFGSRFAPSIVLTGENRETISEMVMAGAGLALVPALETDDTAGVEHVPLIDPPLTQSIYAVALDSARVSAAVAGMLDELVLASRAAPA